MPLNPLTLRQRCSTLTALTFVFAVALPAQQSPATATPAPTPAPPQILTPPTPPTPAIHGPKIFGVHPGSPFLYSIPATGDRPMTFAATHLPTGLKLDKTTGRITGTLNQRGDFPVTLIAKNHLGKAQRPFTIRVSDEIGLTPAMGWNSWNIWATGINQERVLAAAHAMVDSGLAQHGFSYINLDDGWQGTRGGPLNALQPNPAIFPDMKRLADQVHDLGLKIGIYHTPWVTSYGGRTGGSSDDPTGAWDRATMNTGPKNKKQYPFAIGKYHFNRQDAQQFAAWGMDYLKFDWAPIEAPETREEQEALRATHRDILFSLSNNATNTLLGNIAEVSPYANSWRISNDINDKWSTIQRNGFHKDAWAPFARPGHFNDPDMLVVGVVGLGKPPHPTLLTPDEQYSHISLWCLSASPLLLGNDLTQLDAFTKSLLTNDEVLDLDQDTLGKQATDVAHSDTLPVYAKPLEDGTWAVGLFNLTDAPATVTLHLSDLGLKGPQTVRDLWRQKDIGQRTGEFSAPVNPHGVVLIRLIPAK
jgi:alpha-galactosidase